MSDTPQTVTLPPDIVRITAAAESIAKRLTEDFPGSVFLLDRTLETLTGEKHDLLEEIGRLRLRIERLESDLQDSRKLLDIERYERYKLWSARPFTKGEARPDGA